MAENKVLLSVKDLVVKFNVRGRILTAIRGISLDIHEGESIAIVGESGSGKSVFTKTFAGMLDGNGFIDRGDILFNDDELVDTVVKMNGSAWKRVRLIADKLNHSARYEAGSQTYNALADLKKEKDARGELTPEEAQKYHKAVKEMTFQRTELFNYKQTLDPANQKAEIRECAQKLKDFDLKIKALQQEAEEHKKQRRQDAAADTVYLEKYNLNKADLKARYAKEIETPITDAQKKRNARLADEIYLSVGRYSWRKREKCIKELLAILEEAMKQGKDLNDDAVLNSLFDAVTFRVKFLDKNDQQLHGTSVINLAKVKDGNDWTQIRGKKIATVFQDPMTSLNPIITIGKQITSIIIKHQHCSEVEARTRALELMHKVGIPHPEKRFDDYPFQYSGGMRQRIVIAIALSCQPKILICDEPTTALDVTIQAQILKLLKDLQREFKYTIVFITHDLGVVANISERVAVMYAGQIVEVGTVEEVFYDPRHPYTWALLSSLPQLARKDQPLYSITGTPPSLYNEIVGDPFAPRNPYCLKIDTLMDSPMFKITDTHYAKTWLLDPRAPEIKKPEIIENIHEKLMKNYHLEGGNN